MKTGILIFFCSIAFHVMGQQYGIDSSGVNHGYAKWSQDYKDSVDNALKNKADAEAKVKANALAKKKEAKENADLVRKYGRKYCDKAMHHQVWIGMPYELALYAITDQMDEHYTYTANFTLITWTFWHDPGTLVFKNKKLISMTDYVGN